MKIDSTLEYLYQLHNRGIKLGLENINKILLECNNPHNEFQAIHLAGTNGKGSTASIIAKILENAGRKVGLYTSPHLINFNERIRINGVPISVIATNNSPSTQTIPVDPGNESSSTYDLI